MNKNKNVFTTKKNVPKYIYIYKSEPSINRFIKLLIFAFVKQGPFEILKRSLIKKKTDHLF